WASLKNLSNRVEGAAGNMSIEVMAARHPAELGPFWRRMFAGRARREVRGLKTAADVDVSEEYPGLRSVLSGDQPRLYPVTHHQKLAVVDDDFALIGGLDLDERRWDTPEHERPAPETWRDVSIALRGAPAGLVARVAAKIWTDCAADWAARSDAPVLAGLDQPTPWEETGEPSADGDFGSAHVALTRSAPKPGFFAFAPETTDDGTERAALSLIRGAKRLIYMETQFLRSAVIARALADAARANPKLEMVLILPFAPERYAFEGRRDTAMRHGEALQLSALRRIAKGFGDRLVVLSPAKPMRKDENDTFVAYGAGAVYVHSKILITDAETALIGSANMNG
ncbi:MAG: hypothetical protein WD969_08595, partial [Paracoccaceae bacterium]